MTTLREAAQQALDALYDIDATGVPVGHIDLVIDTLKAALAQQEQEPEGGWQSAPSPQVTQRIADMPMSEYRRGVNDGFTLGLREGRIKAEDEMREQQEQEPVAWLRREELADLQSCNYRQLGADSPRIWAPREADTPPPGQDLVPVFTPPPRREWQSLTDEERVKIIEFGSTLADIARAIEQACKERNT
jgi:hypothetical protein